MCYYLSRFFLIGVLLLFLPFSVCAQRDASEVFATRKGPLVVHPVLHGAVVFEWRTKAIYVDPCGTPGAYVGLPRPDIVLLTHPHGDHLSPRTLSGLDLRAATFVVPQAVADKLPDSLQSQVKIMANGEHIRLDKLDIEAVPMYNLPADSTDSKGWGNGYVLDFRKRRVYVSGATKDIAEMQELEDIAVAFICMNPPYTMSVTQAVEATRAFAPEVVFPYHYRGENGLSDVARFKREVEQGTAIDVRLKNWYPDFIER